MYLSSKTDAKHILCTCGLTRESHTFVDSCNGICILVKDYKDKL